MLMDCARIVKKNGVKWRAESSKELGFVVQPKSVCRLNVGPPFTASVKVTQSGNRVNDLAAWPRQGVLRYPHRRAAVQAAPIPDTIQVGPGAAARRIRIWLRRLMQLFRRNIAQNKRNSHRPAGNRELGPFEVKIR